MLSSQGPARVFEAVYCARNRVHSFMNCICVTVLQRADGETVPGTETSARPRWKRPSKGSKRLPQLAQTHDLARLVRPLIFMGVKGAGTRVSRQSYHWNSPKNVSSFACKLATFSWMSTLDALKLDSTNTYLAGHTCHPLGGCHPYRYLGYGSMLHFFTSHTHTVQLSR